MSKFEVALEMASGCGSSSSNVETLMPAAWNAAPGSRTCGSSHARLRPFVSVLPTTSTQPVEYGTCVTSE